ncbi:hypothetical protein KP509_29G014300 [Ceratopteris richardii]|uniref:YqgF/RNase H-like domain-containing protein n=1 Tax=Ceratopteris richardii TaxID=49495 RepID=A0A8T2R6L9_CERRI|nr:hypothetical protein KP509_29G014300 [Ceratopteris richardii]
MAAAVATWTILPMLSSRSAIVANSVLRPSIVFEKQSVVVCSVQSRDLRQSSVRRKRATKEKSSAREEQSLQVGDGIYKGDKEVRDNDEHEEDEKDRMRKEQIRRIELKEKLARISSNAQSMKEGGSFYRYSLGVDYGDARTGVAISKGFAPRPVEVVELQGQRLENRLIEIAHREGACEFIVGLPISSKGLETSQSNKTRCFAGRLAALAAQRGWRVYLHDEFGSSNDALEYMMMMGSTKKSRKIHLDAYAAVVLLQAYFESDGHYAQLVVPKKLELQEQLCEATLHTESADDLHRSEDV